MLTKRKRRIWQGLATYANGSEVNVEDIREMIYLCMPWVARGGIFAIFFVDGDRFLSQGAAQYHSPIKNLLTALCVSRGEKKLPTEALKFLTEHREHVKTIFEELPLAPNDFEQLEDATKHWDPNGKPRESPLGTSIESKDYQDLADPICDFILDELREIKKGKQVLPIVLCKNPECNNIIMPKRIGTKRYCSDTCKSARQSRYTPICERNDYQWLYRRYQLIHPDRPKKKRQEGPLRLDLTRNIEKFRAIKSAHEHVLRIQKLIARLEPYAKQATETEQSCQDYRIPDNVADRHLP